MKCFLCKGDMKEGVATHTVEIGKSIIVIKDVPALICGQCGEVWLSGATARRIENIVGKIENAIMTEVAIVNFADIAA